MSCVKYQESYNKWVVITCKRARPTKGNNCYTYCINLLTNLCTFLYLWSQKSLQKILSFYSFSFLYLVGDFLQSVVDTTCQLTGHINACQTMTTGALSNIHIISIFILQLIKRLSDNKKYKNWETQVFTSFVQIY